MLFPAHVFATNSCRLLEDLYLENSSYKEVWVGFHTSVFLLFDWYGNSGQRDSAHTPDVLRAILVPKSLLAMLIKGRHVLRNRPIQEN